MIAKTDRNQIDPQRWVALSFGVIRRLDFLLLLLPHEQYELMGI